MARLKDLRARAGMTQSQLAAAVGVTVSAIKAWENGRRVPSHRSVSALYRALAMTAEEIVDVCGVEVGS